MWTGSPLTGFRAQGDGDADALVRLNNTRQALVQASQPTTKVGCFLRAQGGIAGGIVVLANDLTLAATPFIADDPSRRAYGREHSSTIKTFN